MIVATPIAESVARVVDRAAARLGYRYVAICANCGRPIVVTTEDATRPNLAWGHRDQHNRRTCPTEATR